MKNAVYLLLALIVLYVVLSLGLHAVYGPSYPFPPTSDNWRPDGSGGWVKLGDPSGPMPDVPSENIPVLLGYVPLLVPGLLLVLFLFTPLSRMLEGRQPVESDEYPEEEVIVFDDEDGPVDDDERTDVSSTDKN